MLVPPSWLPISTTLAPTPTHSPCLKPLNVVAPATAAPSSVSRPMISHVTTLACKRSLTLSVPWLASRATANRPGPHRKPAVTMTMPAQTRPQAIGPRRARQPPLLSRMFALLSSSSGMTSVGKGRQMHEPMIAPSMPKARCRIGWPYRAISVISAPCRSWITRKIRPWATPTTAPTAKARRWPAPATPPPINRLKPWIACKSTRPKMVDQTDADGCSTACRPAVQSSCRP